MGEKRDRGGDGLMGVDDNYLSMWKKNPTNPSEEARYALDLYPSIQRKTHCSNHHVLFYPLPLIINPSLSSSPQQPPHHHHGHHHHQQQQQPPPEKKKEKIWHHWNGRNLACLSFPLILSFYCGWSEKACFSNTQNHCLIFSLGELKHLGPIIC